MVDLNKYKDLFISQTKEKLDGIADLTVQLEKDGVNVIGKGASTDIIEASAKAYIDGLNKLAALIAP